MMLPASKSIPKGSAFLSLELSYSCHFASGCASCRPAGTQEGPDPQKCVKIIQKQFKTCRSPVKRAIKDPASGGPESPHCTPQAARMSCKLPSTVPSLPRTTRNTPDNSCLWLPLFWLPWLTDRNQKKEQSARSATHTQKRGRRLSL
jgi:hypothetical protein